MIPTGWLLCHFCVTASAASTSSSTAGTTWVVVMPARGRRRGKNPPKRPRPLRPRPRRHLAFACGIGKLLPSRLPRTSSQQQPCPRRGSLRPPILLLSLLLSPRDLDPSLPLLQRRGRGQGSSTSFPEEKEAEKRAALFSFASSLSPLPCSPCSPSSFLSCSPCYPHPPPPPRCVYCCFPRQVDCCV